MAQNSKPRGFERRGQGRRAGKLAEDENSWAEERKSPWIRVS
jgi:hypothetical protein